MSDFLILCPVLLPSPAGDHDITTLVTDWSMHGDVMSECCIHLQGNRSQGSENLNVTNVLPHLKGTHKSLSENQNAKAMHSNSYR